MASSSPQDIIRDETNQQIFKKRKTDYVNNDSILKEVVKKECKSQMEWERKWKSLKGDEVNKISDQIISNFNVDMELLNRLHHSSWKTHQVSCAQNNSQLTPYPILTSQLIGWRVSDHLDLNTRRLQKNKYYKTTTQASLWLG